MQQGANAVASDAAEMQTLGQIVGINVAESGYYRDVSKVDENDEEEPQNRFVLTLEVATPAQSLIPVKWHNKDGDELTRHVVPEPDDVRTVTFVDDGVAGLFGRSVEEMEEELDPVTSWVDDAWEQVRGCVVSGEPTETHEGEYLRHKVEEYWSGFLPVDLKSDAYVERASPPASVEVDSEAVWSDDVSVAVNRSVGGSINPVISRPDSIVGLWWFSEFDGEGVRGVVVPEDGGWRVTDERETLNKEDASTGEELDWDADDIATHAEFISGLATDVFDGGN